MANTLRFDTKDLGRDYGNLLATVKETGEIVKPRGMAVVEVRPLVLDLSDPQRCIVAREGFNPALMWVEAMQLVAGTYAYDLLKQVAPKAAEMSSAYGAYGPRTHGQLADAVDELKRDPDSRRAMVYVGRPDDLRLADDLTMPCTASWQFFIRNGSLDMLTTMRSWDLVWGLSYDVPQFVAVQMVVAQAVGCPLGTYTHVAGSAHIYEQYWDLVPQVSTRKLKLRGYSDIQVTQARARGDLQRLRSRIYTLDVFRDAGVDLKARLEKGAEVAS